MASIKYNPIEYNKFGRGMITVFEPAIIPDDACVYAQNVEIGADGSIAPRKGKVIFGNYTSGTEMVSDTHTSRRRDGLDIPLRIRQDGSNGVLEFYYGATWNVLYSGFTSDLTTAFADYVTSTYDRVYISNDTDSNREWNMAVTLLTADASAGASTLTVSSTTGFDSSGTVELGGETVTYTGVTSTTFTGVTGVTASRSSGDAIGQSTAANGSLVKGSILLVKDGHLTIAGISDKGPTMYLSSVTDPEDFTNSSPRLAGEGDIEDFPEQGGPITSVHEKDKWWVVFKEDLIRLFTLEPTTSSAGTGGAEEVPITKMVTRHPDAGAVNHKGTVVADNEVFFVSKKGGLRSLNSTLNDNSISELEVKDYFDVIRPTIEDYDFTSAATVYFDKKVLVSCKTSSDESVNNSVIVYDMRTSGIVIYKGWNVSSWFVYNRKLYFGSSADPNTYEAFSNYTDTLGTTTESAVDTIWRSKRFSFGKMSQQKEVDLIYVEGLINGVTELEVTIRYDEEGSRGQIVKTILGTGPYVTATGSNELGVNELGLEPFGGSLAGEQLDRFRVYLTLPNEYSLYNLDIQFRSNTAGARWKVTNFSVNPVLQEEPPAHLKL